MPAPLPTGLGTLSFSHEAHDGVKETKYSVFKNYLHAQLQLKATDAFTLRIGAELTDYKTDRKTTILGGQDSDTMDELIPRFWVVREYMFNADHRLKIQSYAQKLRGSTSRCRMAASLSRRLILLCFSGNLPVLSL